MKASGRRWTRSRTRSASSRSSRTAAASGRCGRRRAAQPLRAEMLRLQLAADDAPLKVLAIGAHADDIEIGCGGTLLRLAQADELDLRWVVLSAGNERAEEARASAAAFGAEVEVESFRDAFFR